VISTSVGRKMAKERVLLFGALGNVGQYLFPLLSGDENIELWCSYHSKAPEESQKKDAKWVQVFSYLSLYLCSFVN
jgi:hypothetical protein